MIWLYSRTRSIDC